MVVFKGMFDLISKSRKTPLSEKVAMMRDATAVLSPDAILATEKRQQVLQEIRQLLNLPDEEYNVLFLSVIQNFAVFIQNLPETERSYYASAGGWLDHALERTALSLLLCRTYLAPENATLSSLSAQDMLWVYAVFTASLVYDIGKIMVRHVITLTDSAGTPIRPWLPFSGPMLGQATHYIFGFSEEHHEHLRHLITPLLARQILPAGNLPEENETEGGEGEGGHGGFNWIASDPDVLEAWLALLSDQSRQRESILSVIPIADAELLQGFFSDRKTFIHTLSARVQTLRDRINRARKDALQKQQKETAEKKWTDSADKDIGKTSDERKTKGEKYGLFGLPLDAAKESLQKQAKSQVAFAAGHYDQQTIKETTQQFMSWLQNQVEKQKVSVNQTDSMVNVAKEGVIIDHALLQKFLGEEKLSHATNAQQLEQILRTSQMVNPVTYMQIIQKEGGVIQPALMITNPYIIFPHGAPPPLMNYQVVPANTAPPTVLPIKTPQENYEAQQTAQAKQQPHTPTFLPPSSRGGR